MQNKSGKLDLIAETIYSEIMENVYEKIEDYEAVYEDSFSLDNGWISDDITCEDVEYITGIIRKRLEKDEYVFELKAGLTCILVTIYLLEKTARQYQTIETKINKIISFSMVEAFCSQSAFGSVLWMAIMLLSATFIYLLRQLLSNHLFLFSSISFLVCFVFVVVAIGIKEKRITEMKEAEAKELNLYIKNVDRVFCNEKSNKKEIKELYDKYPINDDWKYYLR